ncbi:aminodeoxychorismate synthase component I [Aureimonas mangrovi]|uniref:aminodeoxychorismate synthase component I n=1 Tax=Aureimonas mangrovi TaxID=2758041 RepID=UPI00163D8C84|nr:aminodeoxychorismate synthase component I [Aureimonas mangrovi]
MTQDHRGFALFRDDFSGEELLFREPSALIVAQEAGEFASALDAVEEARGAGRWLAGYVSYEAGYLLEPKLAPLLPAGRRAPLLCFGVFDGPDDPRARRPFRPSSNEEPRIEASRPRWSRTDYARRFERLHAHLRAGDCYQANLTFPIDARWQGDPLALFDDLARRQSVRHSALIELTGPVVLSRSPELFFEVSREGMIEARPMKGTVPRGRTREEDDAARHFLANDAKNRAENLMIVDLLRNDISRVTETGSLDVPELFRVESFSTVHQLVSHVRAKLAPGVDFSEILAALFPCGSITGAPKIRAMEILRELEGAPRDVYCGAVGWMAPGHRMAFNVAIRTLSLFGNGEARFDVGGGVVFDSTADGEYDECLLKARFATGASLQG